MVKSKNNALGKEERKELIDACKNIKEETVIKTLLYTGMRASEFANMKYSWINWQDDEINVPYEEGDWKAKSRNSERDIPLMRMPRVVLKKWFKDNDEIDMGRSTVFRIVKRVAKRTDIMKKVYPHALRATFATILASRDMNATDIQEVMGWADISTANNYVKAIKTKENFREKMRGVE